MIEMWLILSTVCFSGAYEDSHLHKIQKSKYLNIFVSGQQCVQQAEIVFTAPEVKDGETAYRIIPATECVKVGHDCEHWWTTGSNWSSNGHGVFTDLEYEECLYCKKRRKQKFSVEIKTDE